MDEYVNWGRWFSILHRRSQLFVVEACQQFGLTFSEYSMLIRLYDKEGAKQDDLAAMLYLDKAVVTRTINLLVKKGFIYREADTHIYLTEYGRQQHDYLRNVIQGWIDYLVEDMDKDEVKELFNGFHKLVDRACDADLVELAKKLPTGGAVREKL